MNGMVLVMQAAEFAAHRHTGQRRKGEAGEPYVNHLAEVARLLADATDGADADLIAAGWLHDTVEDTGTSAAEIETFFGPRVAGLVIEVTDDKSLPQAERKRLQVEAAPHKSAAAKTLKIADKTSNLRALMLSPPADWPSERILDYVDWAEKVVAGCRGVNPALEAVFDETLDRARKVL